MADKLVLFHLKSAGDKNLVLPDGYWHLATCLRSIIISENSVTPEGLEAHGQMLGESAYEFLLKVICGLDSPLVGETEVLGQFREFLKNHQGQFTSDIQEVVDNLVKDAKKIRADYLQNLGCTSYGSLLRKNMRGSNQKLTVVGAGSLAKDIFPWFAKSSAGIQVFTRAPEKHQDLAASQKNIVLSSFSELPSAQFAGVLVIAAPVSRDWLESQMDISGFDHIYDLRGNSHVDVLSALQVTTLESLFANIESNKKQATQVKENAITAIKKRALNLNLLEKQRPFGWEDLWAYS